MNRFLMGGAVLTNLAGSHMPPVLLSVSAQYQQCVNAGASAARSFFDDMTTVGLHDHIACSMQLYFASLAASSANPTEQKSAQLQQCVDAFAAGYLGRIQQELRLFHGESDRFRDQLADCPFSVSRNKIN